MCSFAAQKRNMACQALYDQSMKKLALIAVCNKLLKQAFTISSLANATKLISFQNWPSTLDVRHRS